MSDGNERWDEDEQYLYEKAAKLGVKITKSDLASAGPVQRVVMWLLTFTAFALRLFLRMPLILLANVFWGIAKLFETAGDGFNMAQTILKPITSAPFIYDWKKQLDDMEEDRRYRMLKALKGELDT